MPLPVPTRRVSSTAPLADVGSFAAVSTTLVSFHAVQADSHATGVEQDPPLSAAIGSSATVLSLVSTKVKL